MRTDYNRCYLLIWMVVMVSWAVPCRGQAWQWASEVRAFSSSYYDTQSPRQYSPEQVLGMPNKLPATGNSPCAWSPAYANGTREEFIWVGFPRPVAIWQVAIGESHNAGSISEVYIYDESDAEYRIYHQPKPTVRAEGMFRVLLKKKTNFKVASVKVILKPDAVPGWNHIDAIAISEDTAAVEARIHLAEQSDQPLVIENLGPPINSPYEEVLPVISPDGKTLYFDRKNHPDNMLSLKDVTQPNDDIWVSHLGEDGQWSIPERLPPPLNNGSHNYVCSVSPDGNTLLLGNVYQTNGEVTGGVSISRRRAGRWSFPEPLLIEDYYNKHRYSEFFLGQDQQTLLLAIERDDSWGGRDLYVSFWNEDSRRWSIPKNLGPDINSAATELTPFLAADGQTLYFASNGHSGYGSTDMFMSRRLDQTWTRWSRPVNLGQPLNTPNWDASYSLDAQGEYAYFISHTPTNADIFRAKLPQSLRPLPALLLTGTTRDATTDAPVSAKIHYQSPAGSGQTQSAQSDGKYRLNLPQTPEIRFWLTAKGYLPLEQQVSVDSLPEFLDFALEPLQVGRVIALERVLFEQGKDELLTDSYEQLNQVFELMRENPGLQISLAGHTDIEGSPIQNMKLSELRVEQIKQYLVVKGVDPERIATRPYGATRPLSRARDALSKQQNRRVEFEITGYDSP
ncbi:MAG: OmpA family protein [Bernardetiaceae bacterium]